MAMTSEYSQKIMLSRLVVSIFLLSWQLLLGATNASTEFAYEGFNGVSSTISLDGIAQITPANLLKLTNRTAMAKGHAFYSSPIRFRESSNSSVYSFSTYFVFAIVSDVPDQSGHGMAFAIVPSTNLSTAQASWYLGLFNTHNDGSSSNRIVAVEIDTSKNQELDDIDSNHIGISVNGLKARNATTAEYYTGGENGEKRSLSLSSGDRIQIWIDYDGMNKVLAITLSPFDVPRPATPLLSTSIDLYPIISENMFVGFSSATGSLGTSHYVLGWSFNMSGQAPLLDLSRLPMLPNRRTKSGPKVELIILVCVSIVVATGVALFYVVRRKIRYAEVVDDWEHEYGTHRFSYKDLFMATDGFREKQLLGKGGFGRVYKGVLPTTKEEVAVKRISDESKQGMREFVAEIVSLGRVRHRNLVKLLGYCRRKGELLLVYDFMPNGSLDKFLFGPHATLNWPQRFRVLRGVAAGLLYLHEEWEQVVLHRDIKASNVLLDGELNGRLGDFGLARLHNHGSDPQTTRVVGTVGYIAPELTTTGKATTCTDVFAFGAFVLEVTCAKRPIDNEKRLASLVLDCWKEGSVLDARDPKLGTEFDGEELEMVMKLGVLCSHPLAAARPSMRQVMQVLEGNAPLPDVSPDDWVFKLMLLDSHGSQCSLDVPFANSFVSMPSSVLSGGR